MDKAKRKGQPVNLRRYWLIFGLLAIIVTIPFRLMNLWLFTNLIYLAVSVVSGFVLARFVNRYGWRYSITIVLLICTLMPIFQMFSYRHYHQYPCGVRNTPNSLVHSVVCSEGCDTHQHMIVLGDSIIAIQTYFGRYVPFCLP